jgi:hypothetical protein
MRAQSAFLSCMFFLVCMVPGPARAAAADAAPVLTARETGVALYARQDAETDRIATLAKGDILVPLVEAVGAETWYMVRTKQGLVGWVRAADIVADNQAKEAFKEKESGSSTWSARSADGRTFNGTWSVAANSTARSASGGWTMSDASGVTVMRGGWAADKHETGWNGVWRAVVEGRQDEYTGSWSAELSHVRNAGFSDLFAAAAKEALRGLWTGASASGTWSIRYAK